MVTGSSTANVDERQCQWCGEEIIGAPFRYDNCVFCSVGCINAYQKLCARLKSSAVVIELKPKGSPDES